MKPNIRMAAALAAAFLCLPAFALPAYAMSDEPPEQPPAQETPAPEDTTTAKPFTPEGTGTVIDEATDQDGKEFYTIQTPSENVFYLVIDRQRTTENVYFLNAVTERDLMALAESAGEPVTVEPEATPAPEPDPAPTPEPEPAPKQGGGPLGTVLLVVAVVVLGGGAGWYFKIYRPKHQAPDLDEQDMLDYEPEGPGDGETEADEGDGPPWEDGDGEEDGE